MYNRHHIVACRLLGLHDFHPAGITVEGKDAKPDRICLKCGKYEQYRFTHRGKDVYEGRNAYDLNC